MLMDDNQCHDRTERCLKRGVLCSYREGALHPVTVGTANSTHNNLLNQIKEQQDQINDLTQKLTEAQAALVLANAQIDMYKSRDSLYSPPTSLREGTPSDLQCEDTLLQPTINEWIIMSQYFNLTGYAVLQNFHKHYLDNFATIPASLRLILCAHGTFQYNQKLSMEFYKRARKAATRESQLTTCYQIATNFFLSDYDTKNGHPILAEAYFTQAIRISLIFQRLDYDPDIINPSMPCEEKQLRRHLFWTLYYMTKNVAIVLSKPGLPTIDCSRVKFAVKPFTTKSMINSAYPDVATICYLSGFLDLIHETTKHYQTPPLTIRELLNSTTCEFIRNRIQDMKAKIPSLLILSEGCSLQYLEFTSSFRDRETVTDSLHTTFLYNTTVLVLNRPILYLTRFFPMESSKLVEITPTLIHTLSESVTAAQTTVGLVSWLVHQSKLGLDGENGTFRGTFFRDLPFVSFHLFEAVISLWFALTQTRSYWWTIISSNGGMSDQASMHPSNSTLMGLEDRKRIRGQVLDVLLALRDLEASLSTSVNRNIFHPRYETSNNLISPMVACIARMVEQLEAVEKRLEGYPQIDSEEQDSVSEATLEMSVVSLEANSNIPSLTLDPWVILGFLGVDINGLRWSAWYEDDWCKFWSYVEKERN
ncbi:hypothetical protein BCR33DRAFT_747703 [Rhizoclosmatium globosum]|uniref:Transcription factor domain-containing protein n=1 Tax=Rhizoclosmatium globosum TaxID=329046 RepID=A0A1Y2AQJ8_9FUNG|nr:hypothetical protein BCR33DRAFT_747703 [Rhizoclosmatium globosum]|eukprot:ORY24802.1 hypothetical protein BCR33DRAFT_747703 [Rhizoclosmatium globosum]